MKQQQETVRVSVDFLIDEHVLLKTTCAQSRIAIKEYIHNKTMEGLKELREKEFKDRLKKSIKQSKEGKVSSLGSFSKYVEDDI